MERSALRSSQIDSCFLSLLWTSRFVLISREFVVRWRPMTVRIPYNLSFYTAAPVMVQYNHPYCRAGLGAREDGNGTNTNRLMSGRLARLNGSTHLRVHWITCILAHSLDYMRTCPFTGLHAYLPVHWIRCANGAGRRSVRQHPSTCLYLRYSNATFN